MQSVFLFSVNYEDLCWKASDNDFASEEIRAESTFIPPIEVGTVFATGFGSIRIKERHLNASLSCCNAPSEIFMMHPLPNLFHVISLSNIIGRYFIFLSINFT